MNLIDALHFKCNNIHCEEENDRQRKGEAEAVWARIPRYRQL